jgi:hypothetical protein
MANANNDNADHDKLRAALGKDNPDMPYGLPPGFVFSMTDKEREELGIPKP